MDQLAVLFGLLASPERLSIISLLCQHDHASGQIVTALQISQPAASKQLRILREAGLIVVTQYGRRRVYHLDPARFEPITLWLKQIERYGMEPSTPTS